MDEIRDAFFELKTEQNFLDELKYLYKNYI
jgi:hypothetical protein